MLAVSSIFVKAGLQVKCCETRFDGFSMSETRGAIISAKYVGSTAKSLSAAVEIIAEFCY